MAPVANCLSFVCVCYSLALHTMRQEPIMVRQNLCVSQKALMLDKNASKRLMLLWAHNTKQINCFPLLFFGFYIFLQYFNLLFYIFYIFYRASSPRVRQTAAKIQIKICNMVKSGNTASARVCWCWPCQARPDWWTDAILRTLQY